MVFFQQLLDKADGTLRKFLEEESCLLRNRSGVYVGISEKRKVVYPDWSKSKTHELASVGLDKYKSELKPNFMVLRDAWPKDETDHQFSNPQFEYLTEVS